MARKGVGVALHAPLESPKAVRMGWHSVVACSGDAIPWARFGAPAISPQEEVVSVM